MWEAPIPFGQGRAALLPHGGGAYRGGGRCGGYGSAYNYGGCRVGNFIRPRDYMSALEGIPVDYLGREANDVPLYMEVGVAALKKALLRANFNIYNPANFNIYNPARINLLSCL